MKKLSKIDLFLNKLDSEKILCLVGPLESHSFYSNSDFLKLYVDGGARKKNKSTLKQNISSLSIGDNDSFQGKLDLTLPKNKNYSDLEGALALIGHRADIILMDGFISLKNESRFDHLLSMFHSIFNFVKKYNTFVFINHNLIMLPRGIHHINIHNYFGIIAFTNTSLQILGKVDFKSEVNMNISSLSSKACSNRGFGIVKIKIDKPVLLTINEN